MLMRTGAGLQNIATGGGYRPERQRGFALVLTALVFCLPLVLIALLSWRAVAVHAPVPARVAAFAVTQPEPPKDAPAPEEPEVEAEAAPVTPPQSPPAVAAPIPISSAKVAVNPVEADPVETVPVAAPPPQPVAKKLSSGGTLGPDTWRARVLGRLDAVKTYPGSARARRQQGTVLIRFTVDRKGQVLSVALQKTSGFALLDREALALPKRTSPLPAPPEEVPGSSIELIVPVEFYF